MAPPNVDDAEPGPETTKSKGKYDDFPFRQLMILAICRFSEPIAFNSILAYSYVMVVDLNGGDDTNASFYAGLLISAYAVAEALTAMTWGAISDKYGRKPVILIGLGGVALSCLMLGLAQSYWVALLARLAGGLLNGNVSVMTTAVAECVKRPEHEPRAYATQPFVWALGAILGSAMGGFLAQPARFYPDIFPQDGVFGRYPYLLPNLVAMIAILLAILQGAIFLEETNPVAVTRKRNLSRVNSSVFKQTTGPQTASETSPLLSKDTKPKSVLDNLRQHIRDDGVYIEDDSLPIASDPTVDLRRTTDQDLKTNGRSEIIDEDVEPPKFTRSQIYNFTVIMLILALVTVALHQMAYCAILPIYLLDPPSNPDSGLGQIDLRGGMGFTLHDVGTYLAINGFIAVFTQGVIFPLFVEHIGVYRSFIIAIIGYPLCYIPIPFLSMLRERNDIFDGITEQEQPWYLSAGIYASMGLQNFFGIISVPCALILLKNATPSKLVLGRVNGLAMSAVCAARTISSPLLGVIYDQAGSAAAWGTCTIIAIAGGFQLLLIQRDKAEGQVEVVATAVEEDETGNVEH